MYIVYLSITINERKVMIDKVIEIVGKVSLTVIIGYAVYFYTTELISIIS